MPFGPPVKSSRLLNSVWTWDLRQGVVELLKRRSHDSVAKIHRIPVEKTSVLPCPSACCQIMAERFYPFTNAFNPTEGRYTGADGRIEVCLGSPPIGAQEPIDTIGWNINGC
jgi:hypothetical protein